VPAHPTVAVPGKVGDPLLGIGVFPQNGDPVFSFRGAFEVDTRNLADAQDSRIPNQLAHCRQNGRLRYSREQYFTSPGLAPPRLLVSFDGALRSRIRFLLKHRNFFGREDILDEDVTGRTHECGHLLGIVIQLERAPRIECFALGIEQRRTRDMHGNPLVKGSQGGFPHHEAHQVTAQFLRAAPVDQALWGFEIVNQPLPRLAVESDYDLGRLVARYDLEATVSWLVGECASFVDPEPQRPAPRGLLSRQGLAPLRHQPWQLHPVVLIEVQGTKAVGHDCLQGCGASILHQKDDPSVIGVRSNQMSSLARMDRLGCSVSLGCRPSSLRSEIQAPRSLRNCAIY